MALNLNREEGWKYYSSDRISQLMGNGILTFLWDKGDVRHLIGSENAVFFNSEEELRQKILYFHDNDSERIKIAASGRNFYHQHFSAEKIIEFILDITFERAHSFDYVWAQEVYS
jgi:glycosyltransferase involved in cell wall biosynthesis